MGWTEEPNMQEVTFSSRDKQDIAKRLEATLNDLESNEALMFSGQPLDDATKELLRLSLENSLRIAKVNAKYPDGIPATLREKFRKGSLPLMKYTNILTFNSRAIFLWFAMLVNQLWLYLFFEIVVLGALFIYMKSRHERLCKNLMAEIDNNYERH